MNDLCVLGEKYRYSQNITRENAGEHAKSINIALPNSAYTRTHILMAPNLDKDLLFVYSCPMLVTSIIVYFLW
jgi:hypothetical protein